MAVELVFSPFCFAFTLLFLFGLGGAHFGTTLSVDGSRHDSASISGTFAARVEATEPHVLQGCRIAQDADRRRGACFHSDEHSIIGEKTVAHGAEFFESFL